MSGAQEEMLIPLETMKKYAQDFFVNHPDHKWLYTRGWYAINEGGGVISIARHIESIRIVPKTENTV